MSPHSTLRNPFLLMVDPERVFDAIAKSERLSQLHRHLCRPLDRVPEGGEDGDGAFVSEAATARRAADALVG